MQLPFDRIVLISSQQIFAVRPRC